MNVKGAPCPICGKAKLVCLDADGYGQGDDLIACKACGLKLPVAAYKKSAPYLTRAEWKTIKVAADFAKAQTSNLLLEYKAYHDLKNKAESFLSRARL